MTTRGSGLAERYSAPVCSIVEDVSTPTPANNAPSVQKHGERHESAVRVTGNENPRGISDPSSNQIRVTT